MEMSDKLCPACGEGTLTPHIENIVIAYRGNEGLISSHYAECDVCGSDITSQKDALANKRATLAFRKSVESLLGGGRIKAIRSKYKLSQRLAGELFGGGPVAFSKYENNDIVHSESMDSLLRLAEDSEYVFFKLVEIQGLQSKVSYAPVEAMLFEDGAWSKGRTFSIPKVSTEYRNTITTPANDDREWKSVSQMRM